MFLEKIDIIIICIFFAFTLIVGLLVSKRAGSSSEEFFLSGRNMPWWLLGMSMVATTFSTDTPNLVTDLVRTHGVSGNWLWWAFLLTGMLTVFVYAKLWRRSNVLTDVEFYEIRYSGKAAAFLRGFRALYLGVFFNVVIMATVSLAAIKIGGVLLNLSPVETILVAMVVTVIYSALGGLRSVLITDFLLFIVAMFGAITAAYVACNLPEVGGLSGLFSHVNVSGKLNLLPDFSNTETLIPLLIIPLAVQWWSVWYPGAEPGGGGYLVQRMLSAKNEKHAVGATLFFNIAHYALRPWPWIIVALASLVVFPDLVHLRQKFPHIDPGIIKHDLAYPAMLTFLPHGLLGIVVASLISAYMSTMSTHLNWGSSYIVSDFYRRFIDPDASEKRQVQVGRISTVVLMLLSGILALLLSNALQAFHILLQIGAGTGLIFILRWFWWRINAYTEITGMVVSFLAAIYLEVIHVNIGFEVIPQHLRLVIGVGVTTASWLAVTFMTAPDDAKKLRDFCRLIRPGGTGWKRVIREAAASGDPIAVSPQPGDLTRGILCMLGGCVAVYCTLFAVGFFLYDNFPPAIICTVISVIAFIFLFKFWGRLEME